MALSKKVIDGKLHCEDGPAITRPNGSQEWWLNGLLHRVNGPAIIWNNGDKHWYFRGLLHREDGPAIEWGETDKKWWIKTMTKTAKRHNDAMQVIVNNNVDIKNSAWYIHGKRLTKSETLKQQQSVIQRKVLPVLNTFYPRYVLPSRGGMLQYFAILIRNEMFGVTQEHFDD